MTDNGIYIMVHETTVVGALEEDQLLPAVGVQLITVVGMSDYHTFGHGVM